ncbi:MAG TPA: hypothetical protein VFM14_11660 [Gemmatimonadales bacterium]|nr:hypothetical protein [Gemmatimonadales bacterium]
MIALSIVLAGIVPSDPPFVRAERAFMQHELAAAEKAYREVMAEDTVTDHRIEAAATLANIAWRVHQDTGSANRWLARMPLPRGRFATVRERVLMRLAFGNAAGAQAAAEKRLPSAITASERQEAVSLKARAVIEPALTARLAGQPIPRRDQAAIEARVSELLPLVEGAPGLLEPARLLLAGAILSANGPAALTAWRSYYLVGTGDSASAPLAAPRQALDTLLPRLRRGLASPEITLATVRALAGSRWFAAAAALALGSDQAAMDSMPADVAEVIAYARFVADVQRTTDEYYRRTLLGTSDSAAWRSALVYRGARLWPRLVWTGPPPVYDAAALATELARRFGAIVNVGTTAGYEDLHYGHSVLDARREVRQYGREATVRFVALDALVSNGFQSWAWNGRAGHGGWANAEMIVQVRPLYAVEPLEVWGALHDSTGRREEALRIASDSAADLARARTTAVAYFPGLAARLERDGRRALLDSLAGAGLTGTELEAAFTRELGSATVESSIFAHEGRHAIDAADPDLSTEEREFRAKLSQVAFAPYPRLAFDGIVDANLGDRTPHGQANRRVLEGVLAWMNVHAGDVTGLDRSRPLLLQLTKLSDQQLRAAVRSIDPLAR